MVTLENLLLGIPDCETMTPEKVGAQPKGCFMVNTITEVAAHDPDVAAIALKNNEAIISALRDAILKGQEEGTINSRFCAEGLSRFLHNNFTGLRVAEQAGNNPEAIKQITEVIMTILKP